MQRPARGFTLLEVMLVALLMGLVAGAVTLSMGSVQGDRELDHQTTRFRVALQQAQERAVMEGRLLGLRVEQDGWQFMVRTGKERKWQAIGDDRLLSRHTLPEGMATTLEVDGFGWQSDRDEAAEQQRDEQKRSPQVLIFPGNELTPFTLELTREQEGSTSHRRLMGDEFGKVTLEQEEE